MRFMILVKADADSEAGVMPAEGLLAEMAAYHEELARAGVLLDAAGLQPSRTGWRVRYRGGAQRQVVDGPFAETQELLAGYTLIQTRTREEAFEWARRFPSPMGQREGEIEVRQLFELDDFEPGAAVGRFRGLLAGQG